RRGRTWGGLLRREDWESLFYRWGNSSARALRANSRRGYFFLPDGMAADFDAAGFGSLFPPPAGFSPEACAFVSAGSLSDFVSPLACPSDFASPPPLVAPLSSFALSV